MKKVLKFFKWFFSITAFIVVFAVVLTTVFFTSNPQRFLTKPIDEISYGYLETKDGFYIGKLSGGKMSDEGVFTLATGSAFEGVWDGSGLPDSGNLIIADVGEYTGEFESGKRSGKGTFIWVNGDEYDGYWQNDKPFGLGTLNFADGSILDGTFDNNKIIEGTYTTLIDIGKIEYTFTDSVCTAVKLELMDGTTYSGPFSNGKFNGECVVNYSNGDSYKGNLTDNLKSGQGKYSWKNGHSYDGAWANDKMNGEGTYYYGSSSTSTRMTGAFKDNSPIGTLTYTQSDGDVFKVVWENGKCKSVKAGG